MGLLLYSFVILSSSAQAEDFVVHLASRTLSGTIIDPDLTAALLDSQTQRVHAVLRFREALSPDQHQALANEDIQLLSYLEGHGYFASLPARARLGEGALATVAGADFVRQTDKLDPILTGRPEPWFMRGSNLAVVVEFFSDVKTDEAQVLMNRASPRARRAGPTTWFAVLSRDALEKLAGLDPVKRIYAGPFPPLPLTNEQRPRTLTDAAQQADFTAPRPAYRVDGGQIRIAICDDGIDEQHADFDDVASNGSPYVLRIDSPRAETSIHGTQVASIAAGSGYNSVAYGVSEFAFRGHAPYARLGDFAPFGAQIDDVYHALVTHAMNVSNHSYAQSLTVYDWVAAEIDKIVRGDAIYESTSIPGRPQVWAVGNNGVLAQYGSETGFHSVLATAKNSIAVGSVNAPGDDLSVFSSLGPTFDGRIKPDLVAPGCHGPSGIMGAAGYQGYSGDCGTSMAAPAVTGIVALLMHQLQKSEVSLAGVLPSTYKAILVQSARDLTQVEAEPNADDNPDTGQPVTFGAGPDFATGWGLVQAEKARQLIESGGRWRESSLATTGSRETYCVVVATDSEELKATLAWDDLPGDTSTKETLSKLVNDLDLQLVGPVGPTEATVLPWTIAPFDETVSSFTAADIDSAVRGPDHLNNVEMANVTQPTAGTWKITVTAYKIPMGKPQKYSLVSSHGISEACP